jgi:uncharacterized phage-associated protein
MKNMPIYDVHDVANYFLLKAQDDGQELLSNMKLQKLIYYAQGLHLVLFNEPLIQEQVEAWTYGPVVPILYHKYKEYEGHGIPAAASFDRLKIDSETRDFLDEIYQVFGQFSATRLMEISHEDQCWKDSCPGNEITHEALKIDLKKYLKDG